MGPRARAVQTSWEGVHFNLEVCKMFFDKAVGPLNLTQLLGMVGDVKFSGDTFRLPETC